MVIVNFHRAILVLGFLGARHVDVGYLFHEKRMAQAAADAAAVAAAEEGNAGNTSNEQAVANAMARMNGFDPGASLNPATVTLKTPDGTGNYSGIGEFFVEADVLQAYPNVLSLSSVQQERKQVVKRSSARAVAGGGLSSPTCICLEEPTGQGLTMNNNGQINATQCGVTVDSSSSNAVGVQGSATLNALSLGTVSNTWNNSSNFTNNVNNNGQITSSTKVIAGIATQCKPVLTVPTLPNGLQCYGNPIQGWTPTHSNGAYTFAAGRRKHLEQHSLLHKPGYLPILFSDVFAGVYILRPGRFQYRWWFAHKRKRCDFLCRRQCKHCQWRYGKAFGSHSKQRSADAFLCDGEYRHHPGRVELRVLWPVIRAERRGDAE